ncbi:hypothetical protein, partial [Acinetobacter baumannii]|uniref:hypothetical protein n=1 Tax=Acinetobacter baumannii TaxID=470 RepID=UPI00196A0D8D
MLGHISEYYVSDTSGKIEGCLIATEGEQPKVLRKDFIITFGKEILIINEEGAANLQPEQEFINAASGQSRRRESAPLQPVPAVSMPLTQREPMGDLTDG